MKKIVLVGFIMAGCFGTLALADTVKCNLDGNQSEMTACIADDYKVADEELNVMWKELLEKNNNNKDYINKIKAAQNLWIKFRDAEVDAQFACDEGDEQTCWGSMYPMLKLSALIDLTEERTTRLQSYRDKNSKESEMTSTLTDCYLHEGPGKDQAAIQISEVGDGSNDIIGYFSRVPYEKDGAYGVLKGMTLRGLILAEYTYVIEGSVEKEDVRFRMETDSLIEGVGELTEGEGKMVFKNPNTIEWGDVYTKTNCEKVDKLLSYSRSSVDDINKQK